MREPALDSWIEKWNNSEAIASASPKEASDALQELDKTVARALENI